MIQQYCQTVVITVETVVLRQMTEIIQRAARVSAQVTAAGTAQTCTPLQRGQRVLQLESLLFLMRNSPVKLQRLMKCLKAKDETRYAQLYRRKP